MKKSTDNVGLWKKEEAIKVISAQLLLTIDFMQLRNIIHRDLKPDNILLNSNADGNYDIRIADFGFACYFDDELSMKRVCGTPGYIAPEALRKEGYKLNSDLFSVGAIIYNMVTQRCLFSGPNTDQSLALNLYCDLDKIIEPLKAAKNEVRELIMALLSADPSTRPNTMDALNFTWFDSLRLPISLALEHN
jgi:serine/threonine protein kinase